MSTISDALVGKFFHTTATQADGCRTIVNQGRVVAHEGDMLLIEIFDFAMGEAHGQELVTLTQLSDRGAVFYEDADEMKFEYENGPLGTVSRHHWDRCE
ncbi:hypothetical protein A5699_26005 [Mycobacterium sp. E802]|uniref:hypothetical protein n=1 Tax=Mycobacterium sp. E802 TaxID=1834152 RepID=UPI0007FDEFB0|nr:hypothetical protein [Mycobacterium sp. E802]OBG84785.1 hypothetical protein A5699_26005 [Mycobacterium sp. E802]